MFYMGGSTVLKSITIPSTVTSIGDLAFENCSSISKIKFVEGLVVIGLGMFAMYGNTVLQSVRIPSTIIKIGNFAFQWCSSLSEIVFVDGLNKIGSQMFTMGYYNGYGGISSLKILTIPSTITNFGNFLY